MGEIEKNTDFENVKLLKKGNGEEKKIWTKLKQKFEAKTKQKVIRLKK